MASEKAIVAIIFIVGTAVGVGLSILFLILKKKVQKAKDLKNKKLQSLPSIGDSFIDLTIDISPVDDKSFWTDDIWRDDILSIGELGTSKSDELGTIESVKLVQKYLETDVPPCSPIKDAHKGLDTKVDVAASNQSVESSDKPVKQTASSRQSNPAIHMAAPGKINKKNVLRGERKQGKASKDLRVGHNFPNEWQTCDISSNPSSHKHVQKNIIIVAKEESDDDDMPLGLSKFAVMK